MSESGLFLPSALAARFQRQGSAITIATPPSVRVVAVFALVIAATLICFACWGELTRTVAVTGTLVPERSVMRIFSPQLGIVTAKHVHLGDNVHRGQPLYSISSERNDSDGARLVERVSASIKERIATLRSTLVTTRNLQVVERERLATQRDELLAQLRTSAEEMRVLRDTIALDRQIVVRKSALRADAVLPIDLLELAQRQLASDESHLIALQIDVQKLRQSLSDTEQQLRALPLTQANDLDTLRSQLATAEGDLAENEMRREIVLVAPEDGTVSADMAELGQTVSPGTPMAVIAPSDAKLEAHMLVPSSGVGFVKPGALVALRYQAFPYQKFGVYEGHVRSISEVALSPGEMETLKVPTDTSEPIYRVTVDLAEQTAEAFGVRQKLRAGMLVDAEIGEETRRIYEWIFEPIYSVRGAVFLTAAQP